MQGDRIVGGWGNVSRIAASSVVLLIATAAVCACGAARPASSRTRPVPAAARPVHHAPPPTGERGEQALVRSAFVRLADAGYGWREQQAFAPNLRCRSGPFRGARARASSGRFVGDNASFEEIVAVFRDAGESRRALARLDARASIACLARTARERMTEQAEGTATRPQLERSEAIGADGMALRFVATAPSQFGIVHGVIDAVHMRAGRGVGALLIVSGPRVVSEDVYERVVALFSRRLRAALG